jgi:cation diffusion facilitator family transporter
MAIARKPITTRRVLITSLFVDVIDVVTNLVIAIITGSAVMLVETLQGMADLTSVCMLLIGSKRSHRRATKLHPFGYGKELYFWSLLSAFIILVVTASISFYFGYRQLTGGEPIEHLGLAYAILCIAVATNGYAFRLSARKLLGHRPLNDLPKVFLESSEVVTKTTTVLDAMGTLSAVLGLAALIIYGITGNSEFDGIGAMVMAVVLAVLSVLLLVGAKGLVTGQSAPESVEHKIREIALDAPEVKAILSLRTMILGSDKLLVNMEIHMQDGLTTDQVEDVIAQIEFRVKVIAGRKTQIYIEPER